MIPSWCKDKVGVIRPEKQLDRGKELLVYGDEPTHYITGSIQAITGTLENDYRMNNKITYLGLFNENADIIDADRLVFDDRTLVIHGGVKKINSPTGRLDYKEVNLKSYEG